MKMRIYESGDGGAIVRFPNQGHPHERFQGEHPYLGTVEVEDPPILQHGTPSECREEIRRAAIAEAKRCGLIR